MVKYESTLFFKTLPKRGCFALSFDGRKSVFLSCLFPFANDQIRSDSDSFQTMLPWKHPFKRIHPAVQLLVDLQGCNQEEDDSIPGK